MIQPKMGIRNMLFLATHFMVHGNRYNRGRSKKLWWLDITIVGFEIFCKSAPSIVIVQPGLIFNITHANPLSVLLGMVLKRSNGKVSTYRMEIRRKKLIMHTAQYIHIMMLNKVFIFRN